MPTRPTATTRARVAGIVVQILVGLSLTGLVRADTHWPVWRGPTKDGHAASSTAPQRWEPSSVVWRTPLEGNGQSSPIVWGDRIFLTTELDNGRQRIVFAVDAANGQIVWRHVAWEGLPEKSHTMNGWASASCATDGEVVAAFFGKGGLHVYAVDGTHLWSKDLGEFEGPWGTAACPVLVGELIVQNGDSERGAFIAAFERRTGREVWRKPRPDHRGWSTPIVLHDGEREAVILNGHEGVTAYDAATGRELWRTANSNGRGEPTVTPGGEFLYVVCGLAGEMYALRPGEDLTATPQVSWTAERRGGRDLSSPIVVGNYLLVTALNGIASCYEADSGNLLWKERLEGQFSSSPIAIGGLVLQQNEAGTTFVIEPGPKLNVVARNTLGSAADEIFRASLTPVGTRVYSRSNRVLYAIEGARP